MPKRQISRSIISARVKEYNISIFSCFLSRFSRDACTKRARSLTWRQCLLASQPMCWSCGGSGSADASRSALSVRAARAECRALNHTFASALSAALNQHSCTPSGEWSSRIRPSENGTAVALKNRSLSREIFLLFHLSTRHWHNLSRENASASDILRGNKFHDSFLSLFPFLFFQITTGLSSRVVLESKVNNSRVEQPFLFYLLFQFYRSGLILQRRHGYRHPSTDVPSREQKLSARGAVRLFLSSLCPWYRPSIRTARRLSGFGLNSFRITGQRRKGVI